MFFHIIHIMRKLITTNITTFGGDYMQNAINVAN